MADIRGSGPSESNQNFGRGRDSVDPDENLTEKIKIPKGFWV